jgi:hypothetical protein
LGTSSPTSTLFIQGSGSINPFVIASSTGTQLLTVTAAGNVGIGTTSPAFPLDVNGTVNVSGGTSSGPRNVGLSVAGGQLVVTNDGNSSNLLIGNVIGTNATGSIAYFNTIVGLSSGSHIPDVSSGGGYSNSFFGYAAGTANTLGYGNVLLGVNAGTANTSGNLNTMVGTNAGLGFSGGSGNIFLGEYAGSTQTAGSNNILIDANNAASTTGGNQLNIGNTIYGNLSTGNVGIGNTSPLAVLDVDANHDFQFLPSYIYGTSTMAGTNPAISTKYGGMYMGLADGDPSYGIDVGYLMPGLTGTRILTYTQTALCFTNAYPVVDCPIQAYAGGDLTIGQAFEGHAVSQNNSLLVQNRVGIGTISPTSTLFVQGTSTFPSVNLFTLASSTGAQLFTVTPAGNVGIGTTTPTLGPLTMASGAFVTAGGTWTNASDRNLKENFATLTPASILEKIDQLPVTQWDYKTEGPTVNHIGPVAQDFWDAFHLGNSSTSISTIDPAGVALLGIQALDEKIQVLQGDLAGNATVTNLSVYNPDNFSADSVGEAKILAGQTSVRVTFSQPYQYQPIVVLTPEDQTASGEFVADRDASGFTIRLPSPVTSALMEQGIAPLLAP